MTEAPQGSGTVDVNGAAARLAMPADKISIVAYASLDEEDASIFRPRIVPADREDPILQV